MCSFSAPRGLAEVLPRFWGRGRSVASDVVWWDGGGCWRLVGWVCGWKWAGPSGGAYDTLGACGVHFRFFPATPLVHALINVGGGMYVPYPTL